MLFTIFISGIQPNTMKDNLNLNGFPTDDSPSTQLKYDIVASKFMTGIENHHKRNAPISLSNDLGLIGAVLMGLGSLIYNACSRYMWALRKL